MTEKYVGLEKQIDIATKSISLAAKIGLLIGGGCIVFYSLINGHYPQGVSVGDGLLFLIAALCFGSVYLIFTASITAVGILCSPILISFLRLLLKITNTFTKDKYRPALSQQPINGLTLLLGFFGAIFILVLARNDFSGHIPLLGLPLIQYYIYSSYFDQNKRIESTTQETAPSKSENIKSTVDLESMRKLRFITGVFIIITPLLIGNVMTDLMEAAMISAKVRIAHAVIHVKPPYANLLPFPTESKLEGFKRFEKATIIFRGVGNTTLVEIRTDAMNSRLEIPNDSIVIESNEKLPLKMVTAKL